MKKILASLAAGLIVASAVPALAADSNTVDSTRPGYCWQAADNERGGWHCGGRGRHGHGGYCWDNNDNQQDK